MLSVTKLYEVIFPSWKHDGDEASQALGRGIWQQDNSLFLKNGFSAFLNSMATIFYLILHVWTWMSRWGEGERWWWGFLWSLWRDKHTVELKQVVLRNLRMQLEELVSGTDAGRNGSSPLSTNIIAVDLAEASWGLAQSHIPSRQQSLAGAKSVSLVRPMGSRESVPR